MCNSFQLVEVPLSLSSARKRVEDFLTRNGLRLDRLDYYVTIVDDEGTIQAGGGLDGGVIKCVAVDDQAREGGLSSRLISHLIATAAARGHHVPRVFTKPQNEDIFASLGFVTIARAPLAILMEHGTHSINSLVGHLKEIHAQHPGPSALIVMNANPMTAGHAFLIDTAAASSDVAHVYVMLVGDEGQLFSYDDRLAMVRQYCTQAHSDRVTVLEANPYAISSLTFPSYFLKEIDTATDTHITLDLDVLVHYLAPALEVRVRYVGSEPLDALTARYNTLMKQQLPAHGIEVREVTRMSDDTGRCINATAIRESIQHLTGLRTALQQVSPTATAVVTGYAACQAMQDELDATPKPGLVDRIDNGPHPDMNYAMMQRSIAALRPYMVEAARLGDCAAGKVDIAQLVDCGKRGEAAMLNATSGVNTHRGALFALGLAAAATMQVLHQRHGDYQPSDIAQAIEQLASNLHAGEHSHGADAIKQHSGTQGALAMAQQGYPQLTSDWIPFLREALGKHDRNDALVCTLLHIASGLDDTCTIHRVGYDRAQEIKRLCATACNRDQVTALKAQFTRERVSLGGAADMLSLTLMVSALCDSSTPIDDNNQKY